MRALVAIVMILLSGCATRRGYWPAEVDPYVKMYAEMSRSAGRYSDRVEQVYIDLVDGVLENNEEVVGVCDMRDNAIRLRRDEWVDMDRYERQELVLHELGHCVHFLPHREAKDSTGRPLSLMYPYMLTSATYQKWYDYYNAELLSTVDSR